MAKIVFLQNVMTDLLDVKYHELIFIRHLFDVLSLIGHSDYGLCPVATKL